MRVFVTGATGVVGRRLIPILRGQGHDVTAVARSDDARARFRAQGVEPVYVDLFDPISVLRAVADHDAVVNLATHIPAPPRMFLPWAWKENDRLRREASAILVDASTAAGVSRFVQESFAPVYPDRGSEWISEATPLSPLRFNRTILDAEAAARRFSQAGRTSVVLRFAAFYGPDAFQTVELIKYLKRGWAALPGPATAYISSISHDDAASAVAAALTLPAGIYNVVDDQPVTHAVYAASLAETLGLPRPKLPPAWLTPLFGAIGALASRSVRISGRRFRTAAGWAPAYPSVREGWAALAAGVV